MLYRGSELLEQYEAGKFNPLSPAGLMRELKLIIENIDLPADIIFSRDRAAISYVCM